MESPSRSSSPASTISLEYTSSDEDNDITSVHGDERSGAITPAAASRPVLDNTNTPPSTPPSHALPGITSSDTTTTTAAASAVGDAAAGAAAAAAARPTPTDTASPGAAAAAGADPTGAAAYIFPTGGGDRSQVNNNIGVARLLYRPLGRSHITLGGFRPAPVTAVSDLLKYIPNNFGHPQSWTFIWRNIHLEIERSRKRSAVLMEKKCYLKIHHF